MRAQRGIDVLEHLQVLGIREVRDAQVPLQLLDAVFGQCRGLALLVDDVVGIPVQPRDHPVHAPIQLRRLRARSGQDQRGPRLVDEQAVRFVHDGVSADPGAPATPRSPSCCRAGSRIPPPSSSRTSHRTRRPLSAPRVPYRAG